MSDDTSSSAPLVVHDTLRGAKVPLTLLEPGACGVYCCGPTVYDFSHIGHARAALMPDILVRTLRAAGLRVRYVRNITDVDDKIIARAAEGGRTAEEVAETFTRAYHEDLAALGMLPPDVEPRVTTHIDDIVALVATLVERGLAYPVEGDVYFRVRKFAGYGKLSGRNLEELQAGARVEVDARKDDPLDFALWKAARPGEPAWESPWGRGRPGWHIECSAMSMRHLGETFDVHCGGRDLIFPHHENEIAQSQGATCDTCFARHWMHNGFVNFAGEKMSKSLGNFFTIREVMALYPAEVLRYFLLSVHYRSPVNFDVEVPCPACGRSLPQAEQEAGRCSACGATPTRDELRARVRFPGLAEADERLAYTYTTLAKLEDFAARLSDEARAGSSGEVDASVAGIGEAVRAALADDLNTSAALAALSGPLALGNRLLASAKGVDKGLRRRTLLRLRAELRGEVPGDPRRGGVSGLLGLFAADPAGWLASRRDQTAARIGLDVPRVESLVRAREAARRAKDWESADRLRDELASLGVTVHDGPEGSTWTL